MSDIERCLLSLLTETKNMVRVRELNLRAEVFEDRLHRYVYDWMVDHWLESDMTAAPTRTLLDERFPRLNLPTDVEEDANGLVGALKRRFVINRMQRMMDQAMDTAEADPQASLHQLREDADDAIESAGLPEPPKFDPKIVDKRKIWHHSEAEAKRQVAEELAEAEGPGSWEPVDLGPYLRGEIEVPRPTMGVARSDGLRLLYPGLDHAVVSETGAGKTWFADACTMAEIEAGNRVVYVHYEEGTPASTIERLLLLLGADADDIGKLLTFVGPAAPVRDEHLAALLDPAPTLVVHDGMNEAMTMHGAMTKEVEGAALFRQRLLVPFLRIGAATLTCDHFPLTHDASRVEAYGSVHKGNAMGGPRFALENVETFGRGLRGRSNLFVTKDRPGFLWEHGRPTKTPNKRFLASMVIDAVDVVGQPRFEFGLHAPGGEETVDQGGQEADGSSDFLANAIYRIVLAQPNRIVESQRMLFAHLRQAVGGFTNTDARKALDDLVYGQPPRLTEFEGRKRAKGYQAVVSAS